MPSIKSVQPLGFPWKTQDPFLFCAYHRDLYPKGNSELGPDASLAGRHLGQDFTVKDGWRMYHGSKVPGFPAHPHRGFETVTIVTEGLVDHSDSLGAAGRFGNGDVQWMTAGKGVQHSEMFPLLKSDEGNPFELFQIWLNLPQKNKLVEPYFGMLWNEDIPVVAFKGDQGKTTKVKVVAGALNGQSPLTPPPDSWAADMSNEVAIWVIYLEPGAEWSLPTASSAATRGLYYYQGDSLEIDGTNVPVESNISLVPTETTTIKNGESPSSLLFLQGKPLNEPVAQYGPFVMNSNAEIQQSVREFQQTQFGGWPWPKHDNVHPRERGRFALHADGREEVK